MQNWQVHNSMAEPDAPKMRYDINTFIIFPETARKTNLEGSVMLSVTINQHGIVEHVESVSATDSVFIAPAITAMEQMLFETTTTKGTPVAGRWNIPLVFHKTKQ
jgi:TonB family protein